MVFSGYFFSVMLGLTQESTLRYSLAYTQFILSILTPVITMRLFAEEYKTGTIFDSNDDGIELVDGVIDYTIEQTNFSWNVNYSNLGTKR